MIFRLRRMENAESVAKRINALYQDAKAQDPEVFTENIEIDANRLFSVVNHLQGISLNQTDLDVKGVAFERFLGNFFLRAKPDSFSRHAKSLSLWLIWLRRTMKNSSSIPPAVRVVSCYMRWITSVNRHQTTTTKKVENTIFIGTISPKSDSSDLKSTTPLPASQR